MQDRCYLRCTTLLMVGVMACAGSAGEADSGQMPVLEVAPRHASLGAFDFRASGAIAWGDDTSVVVIDRDEQQFVKLGLPGGSARRGGGKGEGPGELAGAVALVADRDGALLVMDIQLRRLSHFTAAGAFERSAPMPGLPAAVFGWQSDRAHALWMDFGSAGPEPVLGTVDLAAEEAAPTAEIFAEGGLNRPAGDNPFAPTFYSAAQRPNGHVLLGHGAEYRIVEYGLAGLPERVYGRDLERVPLGEEAREAERDRRARIAQRAGPPPAGLRPALDDALDEPQQFFGPNAFSLDAAGCLWVITTRARHDSTEVDVFTADGAFLGTVLLADAVQALAHRGDQLAALVVRTDSERDGLQGIDVYRVR